MPDKRLQYLLNRYKANKCNEEELDELNQWYNRLNLGEDTMDEWIKESGGAAPLADSLFSSFERKLAAKKRSNKRLYLSISAAAAVVLIIAGLMFTHFNELPEQPKNTIAKAIIPPARNKAVLTLSDGRQIILDNKKDGNIANELGMMVSKTDSVLIYSGTQQLSAVNNKLAYHTITVPRGGQYQLILPDQSKVWLNSESVLSFAINSNGTDRAVSLKGEAYFEVAHMKKMPFKVSTGNQQIQVLGTHFNVNGYADESDVVTTLLEGSVKVSNLSSGDSRILVPGQQSHTQLNKSGIQVSKANIDKAIAWKNGYFIFDNENIESIMKVISRWYSVDVEFKNVAKVQRFGGTFSRHSDLTEVLQSLNELSEVQFKMSGHKIIVFR